MIDTNFREKGIDFSQLTTEPSSVLKRACKRQPRRAHSNKLSSHEQYIYDSLKHYGNEHLYTTTLINNKVHARHAEALYRRTRRLFGINPIIKSAHFKFVSRYGYFEQQDHQIHRKTLRSITIIHSVEATKETAFQRCIELKLLLKSELKKYIGLRMIGSIEVEMFSLKHANAFRRYLLVNGLVSEEAGSCAIYDFDNADPHKFRKLDNCIKLATHASVDLESTESALFLVHFHGLIAPTNVTQLQDVEAALKGVEQWSLVPRQVMLKGIRTPTEKDPRMFLENIKQCCKYATKMGKRQYGRYNYLKYNLDCPNGFDWSSFTSESTNPTMTITPFEVNEIHILTHQLMNTNKQGNGNIVVINNR